MARDFYLKIDTIVGESEDHEHKDWIEVESFSWGESQAIVGTTSSSGGRTAERVHHQDLSITKLIDKSTPILELACSSGQHFKKAELELFRASADGDKRVRYYKITLTDLIISSFSQQGGGGGIPHEQVSFNYAEIKWEYIPQKKEAPGGALPAIVTGWSLKQNKKV